METIYFAAFTIKNQIKILPDFRKTVPAFTMQENCFLQLVGELNVWLLKAEKPATLIRAPGSVPRGRPQGHKWSLVCSPHSWGSGADLWGSESDNRFEKPRIDDGLLEVVGVTGVVHMVSWHPSKHRRNIHFMGTGLFP